MPTISKQEDLYNMHMNTWYKIDGVTKVMRVPGGWMYALNSSALTFVPYA